MWSIYKVNPGMVGEEIKEGVSNDKIGRLFKNTLELEANGTNWIYAESTDHCVAEQFGNTIEIDCCYCGNCDTIFSQSESEGE